MLALAPLIASPFVASPGPPQPLPHAPPAVNRAEHIFFRLSATKTKGESETGFVALFSAFYASHRAPLATINNDYNVLLLDNTLKPVLHA